jgi:hypothetical protein
LSDMMYCRVGYRCRGYNESEEVGQHSRVSRRIERARRFDSRRKCRDEREETDQHSSHITLSPHPPTHLFNILQYHIRMPIKRFHPRQQLLVVPQTNQDLTLIPNCLLEDREWSLRDFIFLQFPDLGFVKFGTGNVGVLT